ncbi:hypothetical protein A2U01_0074950, partial [Trifolium medium]|nr:hypothetical protein [Trifolium medium]
QDQQSASLAPSNKSEPAGSSNSSPTSDADKTASDHHAVGQFSHHAGVSSPVNQEIIPRDDLTDVLSTIDNFLYMTYDPSASILRLSPADCVMADSL